MTERKGFVDTPERTGHRHSNVDLGSISRRLDEVHEELFEESEENIDRHNENKVHGQKVRDDIHTMYVLSGAILVVLVLCLFELYQLNNTIGALAARLL